MGIPDPVRLEKDRDWGDWGPLWEPLLVCIYEEMEIKHRAQVLGNCSSRMAPVFIPTR